MTILTSYGSFAISYLEQFKAEVVSAREIGEKDFFRKIVSAKTIIHNASTINCDSLDKCLENNFEFTRKIIKILEKENPNVRLIILSSMSILDPNNENMYGDPLSMTPYAYSKYLAETYCLKSNLKNATCIRFSTLYYKNSEKDGLSKLVKDAVENGEITIFNKGIARRNLLPINIAVKYVNKIVSLGQVKPIYTLSAPTSISFNDVALILKKELPDLRINNVTAEQVFPNVLSDFSFRDAEQLGKMDYLLEDEIASHIKELMS